MASCSAKGKLLCENGRFSHTDWCWCHTSKAGSGAVCSNPGCQATAISPETAVTHQDRICACCWDTWMASRDPGFEPCNGGGCAAARHLAMEARQRRAASRLPLLPPGWAPAPAAAPQYAGPPAAPAPPPLPPGWAPAPAAAPQYAGPPAAPAPAPLPPGWAQHYDSQGRPYYENLATNTTTWERPTAQAAQPPVPHKAAPALAPPLPGWAPAPATAGPAMAAPAPAPLPHGWVQHGGRPQRWSRQHRGRPTAQAAQAPWPPWSDAAMEAAPSSAAPPTKAAAMESAPSDAIPVQAPPTKVPPTKAPPMKAAPMVPAAAMEAPQEAAMEAAPSAAAMEAAPSDAAPPTKAAAMEAAPSDAIPWWEANTDWSSALGDDRWRQQAEPAGHTPVLAQPAEAAGATLEAAPIDAIPVQAPPTKVPPIKAPPVQAPPMKAQPTIVAPPKAQPTKAPPTKPQCRFIRATRVIQQRWRFIRAQQPPQQGLQGATQEPPPGLAAPPAAPAEHTLVAPPAGSTTTTTTYWPMTLSEYEHLAEREERKRRGGLRRAMQLFDWKVAVRNVQRMRLPDPLPDSWQLAPTGSATTLPARLATPSPSLGAPCGARRRPATLPNDWHIAS